MSIVITGNPGVGKHTIAKNVAKEIGYKILDINKIAFDAGLYEKKDQTFDVDIEQLKKILKTKITKKSLLVGHLAPYVLTKSQIKKAIILRKNPYKLILIYKKRRYSRKKMAENLGSEILGIISHDTIKKLGTSKTHQIDTTTKSISKITKQIQSILNGKSLDEMVDWLSLVSEKNDLKKFFPY